MNPGDELGGATFLSPEAGSCGDKDVAAPILIIGYGNELRGDDAVGPRAAAAVAQWKLPGVHAQAVQQLTPELAEPISRARAVIFLDAAAASETGETTVVPLEPAQQAERVGHTSDPRMLLALAQALYGRSPPAWLVRIPAVNFELDQPLSEVAERGLSVALQKVREWCAGRAGASAS